jgi:hypothetical protein
LASWDKGQSLELDSIGHFSQVEFHQAVRDLTNGQGSCLREEPTTPEVQPRGSFNLSQCDVSVNRHNKWIGQVELAVIEARFDQLTIGGLIPNPSALILQVLGRNPSHQELACEKSFSNYGEAASTLWPIVDIQKTGIRRRALGTEARIEDSPQFLNFGLVLLNVRNKEGMLCVEVIVAD